MKRFLVLLALLVVLPNTARPQPRWSEVVKPIDKLCDKFRFDDAIAQTFSLTDHQENATIKRGNIERTKALWSRVFEQINNGKAKLSMKDVSRRFGYLGDVTKIGFDGITTTINQKQVLTKWHRIKKAETYRLLERLAKDDSAENQLGLAAFCLEGTEKLFDRASLHLGKAAQSGADIKAIVAYMRSIKKPDTTAVASAPDGEAKEKAEQPEKIPDQPPSVQGQSYDGVYVTTAATREKIPHPLSKKTYTIRHKGKKIEVPEGMVFVPAGEFIVGDDGHSASSPAERMLVDAFFIGKYEVTNAEYWEFVKATGHRMPDHWKRNANRVPNGRENYPVTYVDWNDANAYCGWAGKRLPGYAEWEKAATWELKKKRKRKYPWGDSETAAKGLPLNYGPRWGLQGNNHPSWKDFLNSKRGKEQIRLGGGTTAVGTYGTGMSPYGCYDMAGNVWEWSGLRSEDGLPEDRYPLRGGCWRGPLMVMQSVVPNRVPATHRGDGTGFRCVVDYAIGAKSRKHKAETAGTQPKKKPLLEGWHIVSGNWTSVKGNAHCSKVGNLEWDGSVKKTVEIQYYVTVNAWSEGPTTDHLVGVTWDVEPGGKARNGAVITWRNLVATIYGVPRDSHVKVIPFSLPLKKPVPVKLKITKQDIQMVVGKQRLSAPLTSKEITRIRLWATGADATFSKVKVKSK